MRPPVLLPSRRPLVVLAALVLLGLVMGGLAVALSRPAHRGASAVSPAVARVPAAAAPATSAAPTPSRVNRAGVLPATGRHVMHAEARPARRSGRTHPHRSRRSHGHHGGRRTHHGAHRGRRHRHRHRPGHHHARRHPAARRVHLRGLSWRAQAGLVLRTARAQRGKPYVWGAAGPHAFDCSGLVQYVFRHALGMRLPKYTDTQYAVTRHIHHRRNLRVGDLVFVRAGRHEEHVGIYAGHGRWWVAPHTGSHVKLQRIYRAPHVFSRVIN